MRIILIVLIIINMIYAEQRYLTGDINEDKNSKIWFETKTNRIANGFAYEVMPNGYSKEFYLKNGKYDGNYKLYSERGYISMTTHYINGVEHGEKISYSDSVPYQISSRVNFVNGKEEGLQYRYDTKNGNLTTISNYKNGLNDGIEKFFYESGKIWAINKYENGLTLSCTMFYENGNPMGEIQFIYSDDMKLKYRNELINQDINSLIFINYKRSDNKKGKILYINGNLKSEYDLDAEKAKGVIITYKKNNTKEYEIIFKNKNEIYGYGYTDNKQYVMSEAEIYNYLRTQEWRKGEGGNFFH